MAPHDLAGLLTPYDSGNFLRTCWGNQYLHVPGTHGKFSEAASLVRAELNPRTAPAGHTPHPAHA